MHGRDSEWAEVELGSDVARIFAKLEMRDRAQAVVLAYETGLVTAGDEPDSVTRPRA